MLLSSNFSGLGPNKPTISHSPKFALRFSGKEEDIADVLYKHRRPFSQGEPEVTPRDYHPELLRKLEGFVREGQPVRLIMPAFPFKSKSPQKTLGPSPDKAETISVKYLQGICNEIGKVYEPGARMVIYSDGDVFAPIIPGATPEDPVRYARELQEEIARLGANNIDMVTLQDYAKDKPADELRTEIIDRFAEPLESIQTRNRKGDNPELTSTFQGLARFSLDEVQAQESGLSRNKAQTLAKNVAYKTIQTGDAWSKFMDSQEPEAIRLSCHPKPLNTPKLGIWLSPDKNTCTPWHSVAAKTSLKPTRWTFMKKAEAEQLGLTLKNKNGKPSHFEVPEKMHKAVTTIQAHIRAHNQEIASRDLRK